MQGSRVCSVVLRVCNESMILSVIAQVSCAMRNPHFELQRQGFDYISPTETLHLFKLFVQSNLIA